MKYILGAAVIAVMSTTVSAQSRSCADRDLVVGRLAEKYGETQQSIGVGDRGTVVEVFASDETGTWTIIETTADGMACLITHGQSFEVVYEPHVLGDPT